MTNIIGLTFSVGDTYQNLKLVLSKPIKFSDTKDHV